MDRYQLAKLSLWAGAKGIQGRKRLQKVAYFLQSAGCPLECRFSLHHYGPYSREVADACDEMVDLGLFSEVVLPNAAGAQYNYVPTSNLLGLIETTEKQDPDRQRTLIRFQPVGSKLFAEDLWRLELGSTIVFFYKQFKAWDAALEQACKFKKVPKDAIADGAMRLAREIANEKS